MKKLDHEAEILKLAAGLKVDWQQNSVRNIIALCHGKISKWLKENPKVKAIPQLEKLVCEKLKLVFEEIWTDEDLKRISRKYVQLGEAIFARLNEELDKKTFATLIERRKITGTSLDRYVAVIDCREEKAARRFFTRWHEIAHLLTLQGQLELPLHRSTSDRSPTERLMDAIAGEIGFYEPFFDPILKEESSIDGRLNFKTVERVRARFSSEASYQATLNACVSRSDLPMLLIEVALGLKKSEEDYLEGRQANLFPATPPKPKLRVRSVVTNEAARGSKLKVHRNMQVPASSLLFRFFSRPEDFPQDETAGEENLNTWRHSDGKSLAHIKVHIQARRNQNVVVALVSPALGEF